MALLSGSLNPINLDDYTKKMIENLFKRYLDNPLV